MSNSEKIYNDLQEYFSEEALEEENSGVNWGINGEPEVRTPNFVMPPTLAGLDHRLYMTSERSSWESKRSRTVDCLELPEEKEDTTGDEITPVYQTLSNDEYKKLMESFRSTSTFTQMEKEKHKKRNKYRQRVPNSVTTDIYGKPRGLCREMGLVFGEDHHATIHVDNSTVVADWYKAVVKKREAYQMKRYESGPFRMVTQSEVAGEQAINEGGSKMSGETLDGRHWVIPQDDEVSAVLERARQRKETTYTSEYKWERSDGRMNEDEIKNALQAGVSHQHILESVKQERIRRDIDNKSLDEIMLELESNLPGRAEGTREAVARRLLLEQGILPVIDEGDGNKSVTRAEEIMFFLGRFKAVNEKCLSILIKSSMAATHRLLLTMTAVGYVKYFSVPGISYMWVLTRKGENYVKCAGRFSSKSPRRISDVALGLLAHNTLVNYIAANLLSGSKVDVLAFGRTEEYPVMNRLSRKGNPQYGEEVVSEAEITSSYRKLVHNTNFSISEADAHINWNKPGKEGEEFKEGNAHLWILSPPPEIDKVYHVPDLVVARGRNEDGSPEAVAVEVELSYKPRREIEETLKTYMYNPMKYKKVIWVVKEIRVCIQIEQLAKKIGLYQQGRIDIIPIITENGVLGKREAVWMV